jgi:voltage-gated potassium channel
MFAVVRCYHAPAHGISVLPLWPPQTFSLVGSAFVVAEPIVIRKSRRQARSARPVEEIQARAPRSPRSPVVALCRRFALALVLLLAVTVTVWIGREGYADGDGTRLTFLDSLYYASVTVTTTGYGDIVPVTPGARLATILLVTPARVAFLLLLVGTTVELLTERWREALRRDLWRRRVNGHYVICGYGVKGRSAARALREDGVDATRIVVVEPVREAAEAASRDGYAIVVGDASRAAVLLEARVERCAAVVVAPNRDDTAVLITLTARQLAPQATIVAAAREQENADLLRQGGADAVITSSETSGRLLGLTSRNPRVGAVVTDLLHTNQGLSLVEREVTGAEEGLRIDQVTGLTTLAVIRGDRMLRYDDAALGPLQRGDRLVGLPGQSPGG